MEASSETREETRENAETIDRLNSPDYKHTEQPKPKAVIRGNKGMILNRVYCYLFVHFLGPEIPLFERKNWLLHLYYIRKDFTKCNVR